MIGITNGLGTIYTANKDNPSESDVRSGVVYDNGNLTGDYVPAAEAVVLAGEQYGSLGTEFTGTLFPFQAAYNLPQEIILEDSEILIFEGCD